MSHWHDTMVDRPETDGAVYVIWWWVSLNVAGELGLNRAAIGAYLKPWTG
jgi:hypothetical protein